MVKVLFEPIKTRRQGGSCGLTWRGCTYWLSYAVTHPITSKKIAENFLAMVTLRNVIYRLSSLSHLVRHSKYGSCLLWVMSTGHSGRFSGRKSDDSRSIVGVSTTHRFLNLNGSQTRISTIGSKVINVSYNTINQTTGKYNLGDFTKTVTLFKN